MQDFTDIDRYTLKRKLENQDANLVEVPKKFTRQLEVDERIHTIVPYLACDLCKGTFTWFNLDSKNNSWINQRGLKSIKRHLSSSCTKLENYIGIQSMDIKNIIQAKEPVVKRKTS